MSYAVTGNETPEFLLLSEHSNYSTRDLGVPGFIEANQRDDPDHFRQIYYSTDGTIDLKTIYIWKNGRDSLFNLHVLSAIDHPSIVRQQSSPILLGPDSLVVEIDNIEENLQSYISYNINTIPMERRIKFVFQFLLGIFELRKNSISITCHNEDIVFTSSVRDPQSNLKIFPFDGFISDDPQIIPYNIITIVVTLLFNAENRDGQPDYASHLIDLSRQVRTKIMDLLAVISDTDTTKETILSLPIFEGLIEVNNATEVIYNFGEREFDITKLAKVIILVKEHTNFHMMELFATIDLWYRCSSYLELEQNKLIYVLIHIISSLFNRNINELEYDFSSSEFNDSLIEVIMKIFPLYRSYLYEPASGLEQLLSTYVNVIQYPNIYKNVDIVSWYSQLPPGVEPKNVLTSEVF